MLVPEKVHQEKNNTSDSSSTSKNNTGLSLISLIGSAIDHRYPFIKSNGLHKIRLFLRNIEKGKNWKGYQILFSKNLFTEKQISSLYRYFILVGTESFWWIKEKAKLKSERSDRIRCIAPIVLKPLKICELIRRELPWKFKSMQHIAYIQKGTLH